MNALQAFILSLTDTIMVWRDLAVMGLAALVIACVWLYVTALDS